MVRAELYVRQNEATSRLVFIHAYKSVSEIPFELEANAKVSRTAVRIRDNRLTGSWILLVGGRSLSRHHNGSRPCQESLGIRSRGMYSS